MAQKPRNVKEEINVERAKAARSPRSKKTAPLGDVLEDLKASGALKPATEAYTQLEPATLESIEAARQEARHPEPEPAPDRPTGPPGEQNGQPHEAPLDGESDRWKQFVRPKGPDFAPVPEGFRNVDRYETAGMRVNKSLDRTIAAIQFAEDHVPDRSEKDAMEERGLSYVPERRQWERQDRERFGANIIDVNDLAKELASTREQVIGIFGR